MPSARRSRAPFALLAAAIPFVASAALAQEATPVTQVSARVEHYVDDDATTVWRPRAAARVGVGDRTELAASYMVDVVSSASIDVVTRASRPIEEVRHEASAGFSRLYARGGLLGATYGYGHEPDYRTHAIGVFGGRDVDARRLLHASGRLQLAWSRVGAVSDPRFSRHLGSVAASGSLARIVNADTLVRATLELGHAHGFQSSAYRTVRLGEWTAMPYTGTDPAAGAWVFSGVTGTVLERHPDDRFRSRLLLEGARALGARFSLVGSTAGYIDSWRVGAGEAVAELRYEPRAALLFRLGGRAYLQSAAWFFRRRYQSADEAGGYLTDDKELGPMRSYSMIAATAIPIGDVRIDVRLEGTWYRYPELSLLPEKRALSSQLGLVWRL